ncbi:MAG: NACHT domain-containing protein [Thainema sp.]
MARKPVSRWVASRNLGWVMVEPSQVIQVVLRVAATAAAMGKKTLERKPLVIKALKKLGLDPEHPPAEFGAVYAYALVEYALVEEETKPEELLELFAEPEIKETFRQAFDRWDGTLLQGELEQRLDWQEFGNEWNFVGNAIREQNVDVQREVAVFFAVFLDVVRRSQTPKEQLQTVLLTDVQQDLKQVRAQLETVSSLESLPRQLMDAVGELRALLPGVAQDAGQREDGLASQLRDWFEVLGYGWESHDVAEDRYFEWMITIPVRRKRYDRVLVRGVTGEAGLPDLRALQEAVEQQDADEGWLVATMRVSSGVRQAVRDEDEYELISCYTLDELLDEDADFGQYLEWLEAEIKQREINQDYIPLGCRKDEIDPRSQQKIGISHYGEEEGWIEGYVDQWLADPSKEHLSVLGEFGTGKTWFALHYAWVALQKYKEAKRRGVERPRLPLVIPLRDYAKAVSVESLFSEFFFRKHEIPLPGYSAFEQLNRMGKLLLIFDGFDEMAARINRQAMIDNFWELAKVVVPGAKAILTCRTEHFPDAIEGRKLLNAELKASTSNLTGEPPQFEVLELAKFSDEQIAELLGRKAQEQTVQEVIGNPQLLDLARRPVMVELILEALPAIEAGKPVDMARVYLYAVTRKMKRDIRSERTFTSLADKLYFLCELAWEMLATDQMSLNYRAFPERLKLMFAERVQEEKELDYWRYDMMGQTMLIRNSEGDYSPAHRSLLEFFVAYKIVASLGVLAEDFTEVARQQSHLIAGAAAQDYTWHGYFRRVCDREGTPEAMAPLGQFATMEFDGLLPLLREAKLAKAVLDLAYPMVDRETMRERLLPLLQATRERTLEQVGYLGGNVAQLMLARSPHALVDSDLSGTKLCGVDFTKAYLRRVNLRDAQLPESIFSKVLGSVYSVAISPDGRYLAVGDSKETVQIWDALTGQVTWFCVGHLDMVRSVAFSPDGEQLASGSNDQTIKLWSVKTGECLQTLDKHLNSVWSVIFSPDGKQLASGSYDRTIKLWSVETGECLQTLEGHSFSVLSVAFSPDGKQLASGSYDRTIKLWSVETGECLQTLEGHSNAVLSVAFSPDGKQLASGSDDKTIKLWSVKTGECLQTLEGHSNLVRSVTFSSDGKQLASGSYDQMIKLWSVKTGECLQTLEGHFYSVRSVIFSLDDQQILSGGSDNTVKWWSVQTSECLHTLTGYSNLIGTVAFSPDSHLLASSGYDWTVKLWSVSSGECLRTLEGHSNPVGTVAFSPNSERLASGSDDQTIKLWSVKTGECLQTLEGHSNHVWSIMFSPNGKYLVSGGYDKTIKLWSVETGKCLQTLRGHSDWVSSVAFSPDGQQLASGSFDQTIKLWSAKTGECVNTWDDHTARIRSIVFSPNGKYLVSGSDDKTIKLWSVETGKCLQTFKGHLNSVLSVSMNPNNNQIASGSNDQTVKLWRIGTEESTQTIEGHSGLVRSVDFNKDGHQLASGSNDNKIMLWSVATGKCLQVLDDRVCASANITSINELTLGQKATLKLLGAIDENEFD